MMQLWQRRSAQTRSYQDCPGHSATRRMLPLRPHCMPSSRRSTTARLPRHWRTPCQSHGLCISSNLIWIRTKTLGFVWLCRFVSNSRLFLRRKNFCSRITREHLVLLSILSLNVCALRLANSSNVHDTSTSSYTPFEHPSSQDHHHLHHRGSPDQRRHGSLKCHRFKLSYAAKNISDNDVQLRSSSLVFVSLFLSV